MSEQELGNVSGFKIENANGMIEFAENVDLRAADLDEDVWIEEKYVEVYPETRGRTKYSVGTKLNVPATITLFKCFYPKGNLSKEDVLRK